VAIRSPALSVTPGGVFGLISLFSVRLIEAGPDLQMLQQGTTNRFAGFTLIVVS
jgi:hypothetical protein